MANKSVSTNFSAKTMYFKELKLYWLLMVLLEANGAIEGRDSTSIMDQNADDIRALDMCTSQNQQRLGSVFGNFTRHHKKGHRRKTTTTVPSTILTSSSDVISYVTTAQTIIEDTTPRLPKPLRLQSLEYEEILETRLQHKHEKHRRHSTNRETKIDHEVLTKRGHNIVKKAYRDSSSVVNKVNRVGKGGIFLTENCTTVIAQIGTTAVLHCEVSDITENTVTWIRRKDYSLLSVGLVTYSADNRFFSAHGRHVKDWALHIRFATSADAGYYECQVPTHPPTSIFFKLVLVAAYAEIMGESEKIIHEGSMLRLVCVVRRSTEPPSYVFWYFEDRMINYDLNGVSVMNGRQTSELIIGKAEPRHSGNYTCVPANARAASVTVHVVQSETPAAMQHGNSSSCKTKEHNLLVSIVLSVVCLAEIVFREYG